MAKKKLKKSSRKRAPRVNSIHELEITLLDIEPRIWRRFVVRSDITLAKLHDIIQVVMGWDDSHLHQFITQDETRYEPPSPYGDSGWGIQANDSRKARVSTVLPATGAQLLYEYDFGDSWEHLIEVVDVRPPEPDTHLFRCLAGERNCPPEDCGGSYRYPEMLAALADPKDPEHEDIVEWIGDEFDAEAFDMDKINKVLARFR
ncbi:MAG: plasmid pRiA4b ORF-3 family protein [Planctomycetota bacterium]